MENRELREEIEELEICESFDMQEPRRSERSTKGYRPEDLVLRAPDIRLRKVLRAGDDFKQN